MQSEMRSEDVFLSSSEKIIEQSSEVQKNEECAVNVKKVGDAVKKVLEKGKRGRNVVIYGVPEDQLRHRGACGPEAVNYGLL